MMGKAIYQKACHSTKGTSDKVYLVVVIQEANGGYNVVAKWGRRRREPQQSKVYAAGVGKSVAINKARDLFSKKVNASKSYRDIDSAMYGGPVTWDWLRDTAWYTAGAEGERLMPVPGSNPAPAKKVKPVAVKPAPKKAPKKTRDFIVKCVDAIGAEGHFGEGFEYVAETHDDPEMLWVTDRTGVKDEWFVERFERLSA